jgi:hypothetical protein
MIRRLLPRLLGAAALVTLATLAMPALSRPPADDEPKELGDVPADLKLVSRDAPFFASIRPADALASKQVKGLLAIPGAAGLLTLAENAGFAPSNIERITMFSRTPGTGPITILRTVKPLDADTVKKSLGVTEEYKAHGKTLHVSTARFGSQALWLVDDKTAVFGELRGMVPYLATLAKPGKAHHLADELKAAAGKHHVTLAMLPSYTARVEAAYGEAMEEKWKRPKDFKKDVKMPPRDFDKKLDGKKFEAPPRGGARRADQPVAFQKEDFPKGGFKDKDGFRPRLPDPSELAEEPLKLRSLDEAFERMDRRGAWSAFFRPALRCSRLLVTIDLGDDVSARGAAHFASEDDAKDGVVTGKAALLLLREMIPAMLEFSPINIHEKPYKQMLQSVQDGLRAGEVKRDGKTVTLTARCKIDLSGLEK